MKLKKEYKKIVNNILYDNKFILLKNDNHHGTNKYNHCKRVSYLSYILAKIFKANTKEVAIAGLLHDFFYGERLQKEENSYLKHPITSATNAEFYFNIDKKEKEIIESHMFHYAFFKKVTLFSNEEDKLYFKNYKPKNKESAIVCISDLFVSIFEAITYKVRYSCVLYIFFLLNITRY